MFSHNTWIAFYGGEMRLNDTSFGSGIMDFMGNAARRKLDSTKAF